MFAFSEGFTTIILDAFSVPAVLTADTLNSYDAPFVNPVTVADVDVLTPSLNVVNEPPPVLNSMT